jgi:multidrug resistance efflux pump
MQILAKFKAYIVAIAAFVLALMTARHYKAEASRLKKQVINEKAKIHNYESQLKAAKRKQEKHRKELDEATKDDSYLDYFDKS